MKTLRPINIAVLVLSLFGPVVQSNVCFAEAPIDAILAAAHHKASVQPTKTCDDATFLRRVTLDLVGRVPTTEEIKQFETSGDREQIVSRLLESEPFARYWSQLWTTILVGRGQSGAANREALRQWMETQWRTNKSLDQIAFDLVAGEGVTTLQGNVNFLVANREDPITSVSRIFLGVQLDCARCHDHPFDRWTQADYLAMQKFLQTIQIREVSGGLHVNDRGGAADSPQQLPRFLTGAQPRTSAWRRELALMTVRSKPFARAMGNRVWQLLLGRGIVDPVDGLSQSHLPSVPALHQALADQLRENGFDLRSLIRTICLSNAYARTDVAPGDSVDETALTLFAVRRPRPLLPEQLIASYATIANQAAPAPDALNEMAAEFIGHAAAGVVATDPLHLERTSQGLLKELAAEPHPMFLSSTSGTTTNQVFRAVLGRQPDDWEREQASNASASDLLYALLHCNEFVFSH